jgi:hypothetical protein
MDAAVWGFVGVVVGGLITGLVTIRAESIRADKEASLDSAKRQDDRRLSLDHFQRETLLELQEALHDAARATSRIFMAHIAAEKEQGQWVWIKVGDDLSEFDRASRQRLQTLKTRVADDEVRATVDALVSSQLAMFNASNATAADEASLVAAQLTNKLIEQTGALIRGTFGV